MYLNSRKVKCKGTDLQANTHKLNLGEVEAPEASGTQGKSCHQGSGGKEKCEEVFP